MEEGQLEALIFTEFGQLLSSSRFNHGRLRTRRKRLISAFESPANAHNVNSFCSKHNIRLDIVSKGLVRLVEKLVSNGSLKSKRSGQISKGAKEPGTLVAPTQSPKASEPANQEHSHDYRTRTAETNSHEEVPDASPSENALALVKPNQGQDAVQSPNEGVAFGPPGQNIEAPVVAPTVPAMVQLSVTPLEPPQNIGGEYRGIPSYHGVLVRKTTIKSPVIPPSLF
ncbi:uncharacterized protein DFL_007946 [Arthrobotrys flagrans]|uniref:Uncharacterized protein n=1 Tax=Arthrobotrys flagrans TaxID=97331 RepID=A0A436ZXP0_ARTFL|nr:hypothetical protein DFL_007946 [Arthrobotrys flagrans]